MGACCFNFNCTFRAKIFRVDVWRILKNQKKPLQKVKAVRYAQKVKLGRNVLLTPTLVLTPIWLLQNTAKTQIMLKKVKGKRVNAK